MIYGLEIANILYFKKKVNTNRHNYDFYLCQLLFSVSDGGYKHIQAYCEFKNAVSFEKAKNNLGVKFVQSIKKCEKRAAILYASKIETRMTGTEPKEIGNPSIKIKSCKKLNTKDCWSMALQSKTKDIALKLIKENRPETYICKKRVISENLDQEFGIITKPNFSTFIIPFKNVWDGLAHVFVGPTNIGKTNYALSHFKNPVHIKGIQNFGRISSNAEICDGIVIDDVSLCNFSAHEVLGIVDLAYENNINIKYSIGYLPAFCPRIICMNSLVYLIPKKSTPELTEAIYRRIKIHNFTDKLYEKYIDINSIQAPQKTKYHPQNGLNIETLTVDMDVITKTGTLTGE